MNLRLGPFAFALLGVSLGALFTSNDARACGGCFAPPTEVTTVTGHRMALSISPTQTVLWDQIQYAGNPAEFAWVLPVKPGARLELSHDDFFDTLEAATAKQITAPLLRCPWQGGSDDGLFGCGASMDEMASADGAGFGSGGGVTVVSKKSVGPYETVTLQADVPGALTTWLQEHQYAVDDDLAPVIDAYVAEGFDFIALRLLPDADVAQMEPVRVVMGGASPVLPLRMVAAGAGAHVPLVLYVIGEGRWAPANFGHVEISADELTWDFNAFDSDYATVREARLGSDGGRSWLTAFARKGGLFAPLGVGITDVDAMRVFNSFGEAYAARAEDGGASCTQAFQKYAQSAQVVSSPCATDRDTGCSSVPEGEIPFQELVCGELDDIAVALSGMHPRDVWLTRLEANLPRAALDADLELEAASEQEEIDNLIAPAKAKNQGACFVVRDETGGVVPANIGRGRGGLGAGAVGVLAALGAVLAAALVRRRRAGWLRAGRAAV
jgi:hypothetical protein